ncbi:uncharacterized protein LOC108217189 [Daucus carota subsp. sativus]|uniref:uncharacterized protein LOC108217189 n=1 Tax=Daucus carota subsp. sativus TaxID=79200 RepID=UPI0007B1C088|nr:PREDICTED: uncharacterized protein LOC108217189 [Daucus carota subsp. sativus]
MEPNCRCGTAAALKTSWTDSNPGRRFWGCMRFKDNRSNACNFHQWFDPPMCARSKAIIPGLLRRIRNLEDDAKKNEAAAGVNRPVKRKKSILVLLFVLLIVWVFVRANKNASPSVLELP